MSELRHRKCSRHHRTCECKEYPFSGGSSIHLSRERLSLNGKREKRGKRMMVEDCYFPQQATVEWQRVSQTVGGLPTDPTTKRAAVGNDRSGGAKWVRSLALAQDVERLICQLKSAARGNDWRILLLAGAWPSEREREREKRERERERERESEREKLTTDISKCRTIQPLLYVAPSMPLNFTVTWPYFCGFSPLGQYRNSPSSYSMFRAMSTTVAVRDCHSIV